MTPENLEKIPVVKSDILNTLQSVEHDPQINKKANYYEFLKRYEEKGVDLVAKFDARNKTAKSEGIKNSFLTNNQGSFASSLAESLPLFANMSGRLGDYLQVSVTKTAKPDDEGNAFIDLVIEVKNTWIAEAPSELQDVPAKMTFLVDVTTDADPQHFAHKVHALKQQFLLKGEKAEVLCYQNEFGDLGIVRPKILVKQDGKNLEQCGAKLGECINRLASDKFVINKPDTFNKVYREYFSDLMTGIAENASINAAYLRSLPSDPKREALAKEYDKIVKFIAVYKKTPLTKARG